MDGVQVPVVPAETEGRTGRTDGQHARTRECKLGCVFTQSTVDHEGRPIRDDDTTTYVGAIETAEEFGFAFIPKPGVEDGNGPSSKWSSETEPSGSGIWPTSTFPAPFKSWIYVTPGSIYGK